jgi:hypothetical protein
MDRNHSPSPWGIESPALFISSNRSKFTLNCSADFLGIDPNRIAFFLPSDSRQLSFHESRPDSFDMLAIVLTSNKIT